MKNLKYAACGVLASLSMAGAAHAGTLTTTGSIPAVCKVNVTQRSFDVTKTTLQNIAGVLVTCNQAGSKSLTVDATNGHFDGPGFTSVDYTLTLDLDGGLLPFNNTNLGTAPVSSPIGAPDATVAGGLPGNFSITLLSRPYLAGTYSESWDVTVG